MKTIEQIEALGGYAVVYADPSWQYDQRGRGAAEGHYATLSAAEIQALPVARIAAEDAVLFLWGTWPQLPVVIETMGRWGFVYKTCAFVWVKYHEESGKKCVGGGMWTRANTEFCLLGVRGEPPRRVSKAVRQLVETEAEVILASRRGHSVKPREVRERIVLLMGEALPAIELFARCVGDDGEVIPGGRVAEGWDQWGDECDSDVVMMNGGESDKQEYPTRSTASVDVTAISTATETKESDSMANLPQDMAEAAGKARSAGGGNYIQHGDYVLLIKKWFFQQIQDRCVITEFLVIEAKKKTVFEGEKAVTEEPNPVGSECSYTVNYDGEGKLSAPSNARAVALGLFGLKEGEVADKVVAETLTYAVKDVSPASGMLLGCSTFPKEIRSKKGNYITGINWVCVAKPKEGLNGDALVAARLAALARSPEECVKVTIEQMKGAPALAFPEQKAAPQVPALPGAPAAPPSIPVVDPFAGWTVHPSDPNFYYQGSVVKSKAELLAAAGRQ